MNTDDFEQLLDQVCEQLTERLKRETVTGATAFEKLVRDSLHEKVQQLGIEVDMKPPAQAFPDIVLGEFGIEVKHTQNDTWRSIANSIFEGQRHPDVKQVYLLFGKSGGEPQQDGIAMKIASCTSEHLMSPGLKSKLRRIAPSSIN